VPLTVADEEMEPDRGCDCEEWEEDLDGGPESRKVEWMRFWVTPRSVEIFIWSNSDWEEY
jgi:hypothetical protein